METQRTKLQSSSSVSLGLPPCQSGFHREPSGSLFSMKTRYRSAWLFHSKSSLFCHLLSNPLHCLELPVHFALSLEGRKEGREGGRRMRREKRRKERRKEEGFPGGSAVKNPPASAGDGLFPCSGRIPHAMGQLSPCTPAIEPVPRSPGAATTEAQAPRVHVPQQET